ncbi:hypothetical protein A2881_01055 [Candidatus Peribacteria bacterium RIFCSPHIGHO2_01_FULL_55_13]|nr:MAG: hypothetical protein A2881_01055 [Candidatus Peribacteria bacterium RIFCSPHIGHO2_01_FULL_55_13]OGJ65441.1 MAG: hypothetical protein A3F36_05010 [Candidatus Peribacteria bacterium RIFCSPHIGHO2_12_FULL_55_11]
MTSFLPLFPGKSWIPWITVFAGSALIAALPFFLFRYTMGTWLPEILPQVSSDALYYVKQMREVVDGHPSIGNPFIREYADAHFPGLVLPMWLGAVPGILGLGVNGMFAFNTIFYGVLGGVLLYVLCLKLTKGNQVISVGTALIGVLSLHNFLIRPVLQMVYPALALFLLCLLSVLQEPHQARRYAWLGLVMAFAFYLYPHLWMPIFAAIGFLFLRALRMRDAKTVRYLIVMGIGITVACLPQILNIIQLFSDPAAVSLNFRSGMVETHRVLPITLLNLKYMILLVAGLLFVRTRRALSPSELTLLFIGGGILAAATSNVVTGKEMDFDSHPLWISFFINAVAIAVFLSSYTKSIGLARAVSAIMVCAFFFTTTARTVRNSLPYLWRFDTVAAQQLQDYQRIFSFLQNADPPVSVILAPNLISNYVPIYSNDYVFFDGWALLHVIPDDELLERFLTQNADAITTDTLRDDITSVAGWGPGRAARYQNAYGGQVKPITFFGGEQFIQSAMIKHRAIQSQYEAYLQKYHAKYAITDTEAQDNPRIPGDASVIYTDDRFTMYRL